MSLNEIDASDNSNIGLSKSTCNTKTQETSYWEDGILKFYLCEISIPHIDEYREMLSCIKEINEQLNDLEPWNLLSYLVDKSIPIKLVDEKELPDDPIKGDGIISPDTLGAYRSCDDDHKPMILLCPSKILKEANKLDMDAKLLCKKVIIHEFAHALMDPTNWNKDKEFVPLLKTKPQKRTSDASRFMEESLANMLTLQYFEKTAKKSETQKVKKFIENNQPSIYKCGVNQFKLDTSWEKWRDYKANKTPDFWSYWAGLFAGKEIVKPKHQ